MAETALVSSDIENGKAVVKALDQAGITVRSAFWLYAPESSEWRLVLAMPEVRQQGPRATYETVSKVLAKSGLILAIPLRQISIVGPDDPLPRLLRAAIKTPPQEIASIRFTGNVIGNTLIEDAYIYRST